MWKPNPNQWIAIWATFAFASVFWLDAARGGYMIRDLFFFSGFLTTDEEATGRAIALIVIVAGGLATWFLSD